jgi:hypothetical protein
MTLSEDSTLKKEINDSVLEKCHDVYVIERCGGRYRISYTGTSRDLSDNYKNR